MSATAVTDDVAHPGRGAVAPLSALTAVSPSESPPAAAELLPDEDVGERKSKAEFRNYEDSTRHEKVHAFYKDQHAKMTFEFVVHQERKYLRLDHFRMGLWEALEFLDSFVDDSDPDTEHSQMQHALQTAESIRAMYPDEDWFQLVGLIHDVGKILAIACKEPQWCTVGDTFPVGCAFSDQCVFPELFDANPDRAHPTYSTELGIYQSHCGLAEVKMSFGHDEYLYRVCVLNGSTLPLEALYMIRFHSCYPVHTRGAYKHLMNELDERMLPQVRRFNAHDLYSKSHEKQDVDRLKPYYQKFIAKYFSDTLRW